MPLRARPVALAFVYHQLAHSQAGGAHGGVSSGPTEGDGGKPAWMRKREENLKSAEEEADKRSSHMDDHANVAVSVREWKFQFQTVAAYDFQD